MKRITSSTSSPNVTAVNRDPINNVNFNLTQNEPHTKKQIYGVSRIVDNAPSNDFAESTSSSSVSTSILTQELLR